MSKNVEKKPEWELRMDRVEKGFEETKEILKELAKSNDERRKSSDEDFAKIRKTLNELAKSNKEFDKRSKEFDKRSKEFDERFKSNGDDFAKTKEILDERRKSSDEDFARISKNLDKIAEDLKDVSSRSKGNGDSIGTVAEFFFKEATKQGADIGAFGFLEQKHCNYIIYDENEDTSAEFDIVLTNEEFIFIIETKYRLGKKHLDFFTLKKEEGPDKGLNRIQTLKKYKSEWIGKRKIILAFASLGIKEEVLKAFTEAGYYVLTQKKGKIAVEEPLDKD